MLLKQMAKLVEDFNKNNKVDGSSADEAEKSIRDRRARDANKAYYAKEEVLIKSYGLPGLNLLGTAGEIADKHKNKKKSSTVNFGTPWVLKKAFSQIEDIETANYKARQSDKSPFVKPSCVGKDRNFNNKCIKPWINACSRTYKSASNTLFIEGLDSSWAISEIEVVNPVQYPSSVMEMRTMDNDTIDEITNEWGFGLVYHACGWLSGQGYDFNYTGNHYPLYDIESQFEGMNEARNVKMFSADTFEKLCPSSPSQTSKNIIAQSTSKRAWEEAKERGKVLSKLIEGCEKMVAEACVRVSKNYEKFALHYNTKGCDIRSVTAADIDSDISSWGEYATEASKQSHLELKNTLGICAKASKLGYAWTFKYPESDKDCKKPEK
jgi:hypothetical protein